MNMNLSRIFLSVSTIILMSSFFLTWSSSGLIPIYGICIILAAIGIHKGTGKNQRIYGAIILVVSLLFLGFHIYIAYL
jgi:hypothetical protein